MYSESYTYYTIFFENIEITRYWKQQTQKIGLFWTNCKIHDKIWRNNKNKVLVKFDKYVEFTTKSSEYNDLIKRKLKKYLQSMIPTSKPNNGRWFFYKKYISEKKI